MLLETDLDKAETRADECQKKASSVEAELDEAKR